LSSVLFTAWKVLENKIDTTVNLERRGIVVETVCAVCAGRRRNLTSICFSIADLLGLSSVIDLSGLV